MGIFTITTVCDPQEAAKGNNPGMYGRHMEAWGLPHLTQSPVAVLHSHAHMAIARFEACQISLKTGSLRLLPLNQTTIAIEGLSSKETRRFLLSLSSQSWKLSADTPTAEFHQKLGQGDAALLHLAKAIHNAYRTGFIQRISQDFARAVRDELTPKPLTIRGEEEASIKRDDDIIKAWITVDAVLQSPSASKHIERPLSNDDGSITNHLVISYQETKKRFILEMKPFPKSFDARPAESITLTRDTISHFDPDAPVPFSSKERALEVFNQWITRSEKGAST